jgi:hypothetical protein
MEDSIILVPQFFCANISLDSAIMLKILGDYQVNNGENSQELRKRLKS